MFQALPYLQVGCDYDSVKALPGVQALGERSATKLLVSSLNVIPLSDVPITFYPVMAFIETVNLY